MAVTSIPTMTETNGAKQTSRDLRGWMAAVDQIGELKHIDGADWDVEIGTVTEMGHHRGEQSHALLFDNIKGYPKGYRVLSNTLNTTKRLAITLGMPTNYTRLDFVKNIKPEELSKDAPEEMRSYAPKISDVVLLQLSHLGMHMGQIQVLRRKLGKPVLF